MKSDIKDFLEQTALCAIAIVVVLHLNGKFSQKTPQESDKPAKRVEQVDSVRTDTLQNVPKVWAISQNTKTR